MSMVTGRRLNLFFKALLKQIQNKFTPVGEVIAYMGTSAPENYLACDGQTYAIAEYPLLAEHIHTQFGTYAYWGGDGKDTFAVPDLRGEFLRGSGTAERDTGSGAAVGEHQDGTTHIRFLKSESDMLYISNSGVSTTSSNPDKSFGSSSNKRASYARSNTSDSSTSPLITSRPTNTSVLYCIKYQ